MLLNLNKETIRCTVNLIDYLRIQFDSSACASVHEQLIWEQKGMQKQPRNPQIVRRPVNSTMILQCVFIYRLKFLLLFQFFLSIFSQDRDHQTHDLMKLNPISQYSISLIISVYTLKASQSTVSLSIGSHDFGNLDLLSCKQLNSYDNFLAFGEKVAPVKPKLTFAYI